MSGWLVMMASQGMPQSARMSASAFTVQGWMRTLARLQPSTAPGTASVRYSGWMASARRCWA